MEPESGSNQIVVDPVVPEFAAQRRVSWQGMRPVGGVERLQFNGAGWDAGRQTVDRAIDAGAGALILIDSSTPGPAARALAALYANTDPTAVVPASISDLEWMQTCGSVRDAMVELRPLTPDPAALLAHDLRLAAMVAAIVQAANRRTPIVIVGALSQIAALAAQRIASQSTAWVSLALTSADAAAQVASKRLGLTAWASLDWLPSEAAVEALVRALLSDLETTEG